MAGAIAEKARPASCSCSSGVAVDAHLLPEYPATTGLGHGFRPRRHRTAVYINEYLHALSQRIYGTRVPAAIAAAARHSGACMTAMPYRLLTIRIDTLSLALAHADAHASDRRCSTSPSPTTSSMARRNSYATSGAWYTRISRGSDGGMAAKRYMVE